MISSLWRRWQALRFRLFQRHRHDRLVLEEVDGRPLLILPQVLNPVLFATGDFLANTLSEDLIPPGSTVLDMGSGSGVGAIFAAQWAARVIAVDINPVAVRCTRINALLHHVEETVEVREGDLFAPVRGLKFDVVLFNPPYLRGEPDTMLERALYSKNVLERFLGSLCEHLQPGGYALMVLSSIANLKAILASVAKNHLTAEPIASRDMISEDLIIFRIRPAAE